MLFHAYRSRRRKGQRRAWPARVVRKVKRKTMRKINRRYYKYGRRGC